LSKPELLVRLRLRFAACDSDPLQNFQQKSTHTKVKLKEANQNTKIKANCNYLPYAVRILHVKGGCEQMRVEAKAALQGVANRGLEVKQPISGQIVFLHGKTWFKRRTGNMVNLHESRLIMFSVLVVLFRPCTNAQLQADHERPPQLG
jgi:hypothetical protein